MDLNFIIFSIIIAASLAVFFLLAPLRASAKQRNRPDRINWSSGKYRNFFKYFLVLIFTVFISALLIRLFI